MSDPAVRIAEGLAADWAARAPYRALDLADMDAAYAVQRALHPLLSEQRGPMAGRKIALSSKAMQQMVGISSPIAGAFFQADVLHSPAEVDASTFRHLGIEAELAFVLARDVAPGTPLDDLSGLVAEVRPAFELIEDRAADYADLDALTLVADNAWCGGVVLGSPIASWRDVALDDLPGLLTQTGHPDEATNTGAADPWTSLRWLLEHVTGQGETVRAGEILITGSAVRTRFPVAGEALSYTLTGHTTATLTLR